MLEQNLMQQQRKILGYFHQIVVERAESEKMAKEQRDQVNNSVNQAKEPLRTNWEKVLLKTSIPESTTDRAKNSVNPLMELKHCISRVNEVFKEIVNLREDPLKESGTVGLLLLVIWGILSIGSLAINFSEGWIFAIPIAIFIVWRIKAFLFLMRQNSYEKLLRINTEAIQLYQLQLNVVEQEFDQKMQKVYEFVQYCQQQVDQLSPKWDRGSWQQFELATKIPVVTRMGEFYAGRELEEARIAQSPNTFYGSSYQDSRTHGKIKDTSWQTNREYEFRMPALFPFPANRAVLFKITGSGKHAMWYNTPSYYNNPNVGSYDEDEDEYVENNNMTRSKTSIKPLSQNLIQGVQAILLRLLATVPPSKLRFTFIDPVALGQSVAPFMHLADYDDALITAKAWSEPKHIEQRLAELTEHMEKVIQKYLRNTYATIEEFNDQAGEVAEAYRILVVLNFPVNFTDDAARRLVSIVQNGPRCGVHTLIVYDIEQKLPYEFNPNELEQFSMVIYWDGKRLVWEEPDSCKCLVRLEQPPKETIFNAIINQVGKAAIEASKVEVPFEKVLEKAELLEENWWQGTTAEGIRIPLGPIGATKVQYLEFGKGTAQHALVAGKTGAGKSTLLHVLISTLALKYSPEEVQLYLIDFKKGVEFKTYATHQLSHARVIAIESEREFGLSVLEGLDAELKRRGDLFRAAGVDGVKDYRQKTNEKIPRILLLVDEFQEFFTEDDAISSKCSQILDRLVRQGRAFGIHVMLGSQTLAGAYTLARSTIDQMAIRIALQCSEADSRLILSEDNPAARLLSRPGEAIYNSANGLVEGNNPFQVAWLPDEIQDAYLDQVKILAESNGFFPPKQQIIFEGNAPAHPDKNIALNDLLEAKTSFGTSKKVAAWLGEPIAIKDATAAYFRRQSGSNLLIVGQNDEAAMGMLMMSVLTLSAQYTTESAKFYILDFGSADAPYAHFLKLLTDVVPHNIKYGSKRQLPDMISEIVREVDVRLQREGTGLEEMPSLYLVIYGVQRARDLEKEDSYPYVGPEEPPKPPSPGQLFPKILHEGPEIGIYTLTWCDTLSNFNRRLERQMLREFEMRVVFQMSTEDSTSLIDSPAASKIGQHRALLYSEEEGRLEKFRPFALPDEQWLQQIGGKLKDNMY